MCRRLCGHLRKLCTLELKGQPPWKHCMQWRISLLDLKIALFISVITTMQENALAHFSGWLSESREIPSYALHLDLVVGIPYPHLYESSAPPMMPKFCTSLRLAVVHRCHGAKPRTSQLFVLCREVANNRYTMRRVVRLLNPNPEWVPGWQLGAVTTAVFASASLGGASNPCHIAEPRGVQHLI